MRSYLRSKIHRATVTEADLDYEGSLSVDAALLGAAGIGEFEQVHVWNITRGTRLTTYAIAAPRGSRVICANGAAAHLVGIGDIVIIATFEWLEAPTKAAPTVVRVDADNEIVGFSAETPGPELPPVVD
jgi:aspartate 1-decarboxylase